MKQGEKNEERRRETERGRTVSEMNRGGIKEEKGEKDQVKDGVQEGRQSSTEIMVLLDGCPPSICSIHCFINSIKLQAS